MHLKFILRLHFSKISPRLTENFSVLENFSEILPKSRNIFSFCPKINSKLLYNFSKFFQKSSKFSKFQKNFSRTSTKLFQNVSKIFPKFRPNYSPISWENTHKCIIFQSFFPSCLLFTFFKVFSELSQNCFQNFPKFFRNFITFLRNFSTVYHFLRSFLDVASKLNKKIPVTTNFRKSVSKPQKEQFLGQEILCTNQWGGRKWTFLAWNPSFGRGYRSGSVLFYLDGEHGR